MPLEWSDVIPTDDKSYLLALAREWNQIGISDEQRRLLDGLADLSVGPLRLDVSGTIEESELAGVLAAAFAGERYLEGVPGAATNSEDFVRRSL